MGIEIERKFLVNKVNLSLLENAKSKEITQYYLNDEPEVRIRKAGDKNYLTIKAGNGLVRQEVEVEIKDSDFEQMSKLENFGFIKKTRYYIPYQKNIIELDLYDLGFMTAEIEFPSEELANEFIPPEWFDKELTGLTEFSNKYLAKYGFNEEIYQE